MSNFDHNAIVFLKKYSKSDIYLLNFSTLNAIQK